MELIRQRPPWRNYCSGSHFGLVWNHIITVLILVCFCIEPCLAVTSKIVRHDSSVELIAGEAEDVIISSQGTLGLGRASETIVDDFDEEVWSINSIVLSGGAVYVGTSPNGGIYKCHLGQVRRIYPVEDETVVEPVEVNEANQSDVEVVADTEYLSNEHIFAMATDVSGRVLAGVSGQRCALLRLEKGEVETVFEPNVIDDGTMYIFAIAVDGKGDIYLGTGPKGRVYKLDSFGRKAEVIYESPDKNILSLAIGSDGFIYAGSDERGIVYKIDTATGKASVLYDSEQPEITSLLFSGQSGQLYAAGSSADIASAKPGFGKRKLLPGRPEVEQADESGGGESKSGGVALSIANSKEKPVKKAMEEKPPVRRVRPGRASGIYRISDEGFVTKIFGESAVFFCLANEGENLLLGTGNDGRAFSIDVGAEEETIIYEDDQASQVAALTVAGGQVYIGTANPAKLIKLSADFAGEGVYTSALIDAGQPAKWGKLQIDADIPDGCMVKVSARSGNVGDVNDPTFSPWTVPVKVAGPVQLGCPLGRFCQYRVILKSDDGKKSPLVKEVAVASTVPNLAPKVKSVKAVRLSEAGKEGVLKIDYRAVDDNSDKLIYKIDFRKMGRSRWIELEDEVEAANFEWDGRAVEDGRYEIRVTASDEKSNSSGTSLTGSRVSEAVVVDNTGPEVTWHTIETKGNATTLKLRVGDKLSVIGKVEYSIDSSSDWQGAIPEDSVYDCLEEEFVIVAEKLEDGEHIISVRISDDVGNVTYKSFEVEITE